MAMMIFSECVSCMRWWCGGGWCSARSRGVSSSSPLAFSRGTSSSLSSNLASVTAILITASNLPPYLMPMLRSYLDVRQCSQRKRYNIANAPAQLARPIEGINEDIQEKEARRSIRQMIEHMREDLQREKEKVIAGIINGADLYRRLTGPDGVKHAVHGSRSLLALLSPRHENLCPSRSSKRPAAGN